MIEPGEADRRSSDVDCHPIVLPVPLESVRWATYLPRPKSVVGDRIVVSGTGSASTFVPAAARYEPAASPLERAPPLMPGVTLVPTLAVRTFGVEERATVTRTDGAITLTCRAGSKPAGSVLDPGERRMPDGVDLSVRWEGTGDAGFTAATVARGASADAGSSLGDKPITIEVPRSETVGTAPWFVVSCPESSATFTLSDLRLTGGTASAVASRAAWVWKPSRWRDGPEALLDDARARRVTRLFVSVTIVGGALTDELRFSAFVTSAHRAGIAVVAVEGDPGMALPAGRNVALGRLAALAAYQRRAVPAARLDGVQYDIEPYLLPAFAAEPERVVRGWAETLDALAAADTSFGLDLVLPFWLPNSSAAPVILPAIARVAERVTVMAYRTTAAEVMAVSEPLLTWGATAALPVYVALECGSLGDETTRTYASAAAGDLWVLPQPTGDALMLILNASQPAAPDTRVYALEHESVFAGSRVSFLGDHARLDSTAAELAEVLGAWPNFKGFALHGVIE